MAERSPTHGAALVLMASRTDRELLDARSRRPTCSTACSTRTACARRRPRAWKRNAVARRVETVLKSMAPEELVELQIYGALRSPASSAMRYDFPVAEFLPARN